MVVPCIHYPRESDPYKLYFCPMNTYKYQSLIDSRRLPSCEETYVALPVFFNQEKQEHDPPKDMIRPNPKQKRQYQSPKRSTNRLPKTPSSPCLEIRHNHWGLDRDFKNVYHNSQSQQYITAEKLAEAFSKPQTVQSPLQEKENSLLLQDFPVLVNPAQDTNQRQGTIRLDKYQPSLSNKKQSRGRVIRIIPQKSASSIGYQMGHCLLQKYFFFFFKKKKK
jgi:hypothetical protein